MRGLAFLLVVPLLAAPALALAQVPAAPRSWTLLRVSAVEETQALIRFYPDGPSAGAAYGIRDSGEYGGAIVFWDDAHIARVDVRSPEADATVDRALPTHDLQGWSGTGYVIAPGTTRTILLATFGEIRDASIWIDGEGASYEILDSGPTFATDGRDMSGGRWIGAGVAGANAHVGMDRSIEVDVQHNLFGWFGESPLYAGVDNGTLTDGAGESTTCPCFYPNPNVPQGLRPGRYRFDWDTLGGSPIEHVPMVAWADVRLP